MSKKLTHHESYQPFSRGLIHHLKYMSPQAVKLFVYILLRVKAKGERKGTFSAFVFDCLDDLGFNKKTWHKAIKELDPYIQMEHGNRHKPFTITVRKYKGMDDFHGTITDPKGTTKVTRGKLEGNSRETREGTRDLVSGALIKDLQAPKKEKRRKRKKGEKIRTPLLDAWRSFKEMRKKKRVPMTVRAKSLLVRKLRKLSNDNLILAIKILDKSTTKGWTDIYDLKDSRPSQSQQLGQGAQWLT